MRCRRTRDEAGSTLLFPETHRLKVRLTQVPFLGRSLERARRIVADSQATADDIHRFFPEVTPRVRVVHAGVERCFAPATTQQIAAVRGELGCPDGYLLFAGTLEPRKNVGLLLDAWEALRAEEPDTLPLVIAGGYGWKSKELLARLERRRGDGIHLLGRVEEGHLLRLLQGATCFVYPSLYEGFGLPVVEALACGVPVVASQTSSLPEVAGDAALYVDPDDPADLAVVLRRVLGDRALAAELASGGPPQAARFSWERSAAELEGVLLEALADGAAAARGGA